jgi:membrane fusion protein, multidrug efflux system
MRIAAYLVGVFALAGLTACSQSNSAPVPQDRPVRVVTVGHRVLSEKIVLTGQIRAQEERNLGFRIDGKLIERRVSIGDRVAAGEVVARIDAQDEVNALRSAEAELVAAQATLTQAQKTEARQRELLARGFTTRVQYEQAQQQLETAQAQIDSAEARRRTARDRLGYTELRADVDGSVIAKGAEPGEVVRAGQMVVQLERQGRKDALFDVPAPLFQMQGASSDVVVEIVLADNPNIRTTGRLRQMASQADPVTRTFPVRIALIDPPEAMRLGATVTGSVVVKSPPLIEIPGMSLTKIEGKPAVWIVDPDSKTVALRNVEVVRYDPSSMIIGSGLSDGDIVVTAGVHVLRPGQKVKLVGGQT